MLNNPIAVREIDFIGAEKVVLTVGAPFAVNVEKPEFWCHYQILGIGNEKIRHGISIDSMQALCIALYNASTDLYFRKNISRGNYICREG